MLALFTSSTVDGSGTVCRLSSETLVNLPLAPLTLPGPLAFAFFESGAPLFHFLVDVRRFSAARFSFFDPCESAGDASRNKLLTVAMCGTDEHAPCHVFHAEQTPASTTLLPLHRC